MKQSALQLCLVYVALSYARAHPANIATVISKSLTKEIAAVKQPIDETITFIGSKQCANVQKIIGVSYEQLEGEKEPDLNLLKLNLRTNAFNTIFNISTASVVIPSYPGLDHKQKLSLFLHGFTDDPSKSSFITISDSFLKEGKRNIFALDASSLIHWLYLRSSTYVRFIGQRLGEVLATMVKYGVDPADIHIIGHSLGAHIAGFTGKQFQKLTGKKLARISGLDPAGPCFSEVEPDLRLEATDAEFVDVIHTDAGVYGLKTPVGQVDYYPNRGAMQPECFFQTCSHSRAWQLYAESVKNYSAFPAVRCNSWEEYKAGNCSDVISYMGYGSKPGTTGLFYLQTEGEPPYSLGTKGTKYENKDAIVTNAASTSHDAAKAVGKGITNAGKSATDLGKDVAIAGKNLANVTSNFSKFGKKVTDLF